MSEIAPFIGYGSPVLLVGVIIAFAKMSTQLSNLAEDVREIKKHVTYTDTCDAKHDEINRRLDKIERAV